MLKPLTLLLCLLLTPGLARAEDPDIDRAEIRDYVSRHLETPDVVSAAATAYCGRRQARPVEWDCEEAAGRVASKERRSIIERMFTTLSDDTLKVLQSIRQLEEQLSRLRKSAQDHQQLIKGANAFHERLEGNTVNGQPELSEEELHEMVRASERA